MNAPKSTVDNLVAALKRITDARDSMAEHGKYPFPGPASDQEFDDWAADVASQAIESHEAAMAPMRCGHSACSQHYIDTGETRCVAPEHTAGSWLVEEITLVISAENPKGPEAYRIPISYSPSGPDREANARRIVACVEACEGIATEVLERACLLALPRP